MKYLYIIISFVALLNIHCAKYEFTNPVDVKADIDLQVVLTIDSLTNTNAYLSWTFVNKLNQPFKFIIEMKEGAGEFIIAKEVDGNSKSLEITQTFISGTNYSFRLRAKIDNNFSRYSNISSKLPLVCGTSSVTYSGKTYNTVKVGNQCWLKENLNVGTRVNGSSSQTNNNTIEKYCYNDLESNCDTYGGLYQWNEAMQYSATGGARGICPPGWHIPSYAELQALVSAVGNNGNALKAVGQGSGSGAGINTSSFSALLAGNRGDNGNFYNLGYYAYFWSSTEYDAMSIRDLALFYNDSYIYFGINEKDNGFSVRCVQD